MSNRRWCVIVIPIVQWTILETRRLTVRFAGDGDEEALTRLAHLDRRRPPRGPVIVAEVGRRVRAALSVDDLHAVCDPRMPGAGDVVLTLIEQAGRLRRERRARREELPTVWPRWADDELEAAAA
jgi:CheY-like chemotaxis protein